MGRQFKSWVPNVIRDQVINYLDSAVGFDGWVNILADSKVKLEILISQKADFSKYGQSNQTLQAQINQEQADYDELKTDVDCILRLVSDWRMEAVFNKLSFKLTDSSLDAVFQFAWSANTNYSKIYKKDADDQSKLKDISAKANELSELLASIDFLAPSECFSVQSLLKKTANPKDFLWERLHRGLWGNSYAWETAPDLSDILKTLSDAAAKYTTESQPPTRQRNIKTDYIRALFELLNRAEINLPTELYAAIATMATIAINSNHARVTAKDISNLNHKSNTEKGKTH